ncbi:uncharacterized protein LOC124117496 isoform X3 [Haliotis rufescens]|uniref:uncharacterized protein LOC124117496 isoform X3 n=1 Tax=Haliotis rufescens TaxID=6454 RepID=UPI00201F59AB|nr:uncharacterized protein LOC124117496 isoform X3 [Haliotis rufescens]
MFGCSTHSESAMKVIVIFIMDVMSTTWGQNSQPCPEQHYYDINAQDHKSCKPCAQCPPGSEVNSSCTNQSDTGCKSCDHGTFSSGGIKCRKCSHCLPGTFVSHYCTLTSNTQCEPCAKDMYSSDWSAGFCMPCSRCSRAMTVERNCSKTHDYKCGDCIEGYYRHPNLPSSCIKCSYCYPDHPGATVVVDECVTKSRNPTMRCMPIIGGPMPKRTLSGSSGSTPPKGSSTTDSASTQSPSSHGLEDTLTLFTTTTVVLLVLIVISITIILIRGYCEHVQGNRRNMVTFLCCICTKKKKINRATKMASELFLLQGSELEQSDGVRHDGGSWSPALTGVPCLGERNGDGSKQSDGVRHDGGSWSAALTGVPCLGERDCDGSEQPDGVRHDGRGWSAALTGVPCLGERDCDGSEQPAGLRYEEGRNLGTRDGAGLGPSAGVGHVGVHFLLGERGDDAPDQSAGLRYDVGGNLATSNDERSVDYEEFAGYIPFSRITLDHSVAGGSGTVSHV